MWQDVKYGWRALRAQPGFTLAAVVALALGIGATTAIFSVVNSVLWRSLPYPEAGRLVMVWDRNPKIQVGFDDLPVTGGWFARFSQEARSFEAVAAMTGASYNLSGAETPDRLSGARVSADFFRVMGVGPVIGRAFTAEEDEPGREHVAVISHALWQSRFGGDPGIIGKTLLLDGRGYTVIGVMPAGFEFPRAGELPSFFELAPRAQLWTPIALTRDQRHNFGSHYFAALGRLGADVGVAQAQAEVDAVNRRLAEENPDREGWGGAVLPLQEQIVGAARAALMVMVGAVGLVLLISCANVANLLLARALGREREIAIRAALGAGRGRLVRQLLTESLLLALAGGAAGVLLALWGVDLLPSLGPGDLPRLEEIRVDGRVLGFTLAVSLLTGALFGLAPALQLSRPDLGEVLKEGGRGAGDGPRRRRLRGLLVVTEIAVSLVLLVGAGLLVRSFARLTRVSPGFDPEQVVTMKLTRPGPRFGGARPDAEFFRQAVERVAALPGVESAAVASHLPLAGSEEIDDFTVEGMPPARPSDRPKADVRVISPDYFRAMGMALRAGRAFDERDDEQARGVTIVSEGLARRFFPGQEPLGKRLNRGDVSREADWLTIVGVVAEVRHSALGAEPRPQLYVPNRQLPWASMSLVVRAAGDPLSAVPAIRRAVWEVNPNQPVTEVKLMRDYLTASVAPRRFQMLLLSVFAGVALALAAVGIYGVISYSVSRRTREIGVRLALGATPVDIVRLVLRQGAVLMLAGLALGMAAGAAATRLLSSLLYGVSATDPLTFAGVTLLLAVVALAACYLPARRATKIDPLAALRQE